MLSVKNQIEFYKRFFEKQSTNKLNFFFSNLVYLIEKSINFENYDIMIEYLTDFVMMLKKSIHQC